MSDVVCSPSSTQAPAEPAGSAGPWPVRCRLVEGEEELAMHHAIRHEVFCVEQAVFVGDDRDEHDGEGARHVLAFAGAVPGGAVRFYPLDADGLWQGDRLAVLRPFRHRHLGAPLVRFAVGSAAALGGHTMLAHVQTPNVRFFETLGWRCHGAGEIYHGLPHQPMAIELRCATTS